MVKVWLAVLRLATSVQSFGWNSLMQDLGSIITVSADTNCLRGLGIEPSPLTRGASMPTQAAKLVVHI